MLTLTLLALTLGGPVGCADDGEDDDYQEESGDDEAGDGPDEPPVEVCKSSCRECEALMKDAYACMAFDEFETPLSTFGCIVCDSDGPGSAAATCETQANLQSVIYATMEAQIIACEPTMPAECTGWNPSRHVHPLRANEWDIDRALIEALVADPSQLVGCDAARIKFSRGSYGVTSLDGDDLLGLLGLQNGDVIESINGDSIAGPADVALAFFKLWPDARVVTVSVVRPSAGVVTLTFNIV